LISEGGRTNAFNLTFAAGCADPLHYLDWDLQPFLSTVNTDEPKKIPRPTSWTLALSPPLSAWSKAAKSRTMTISSTAIRVAQQFKRRA
jgi:hypothetical protein